MTNDSRGQHSPLSAEQKQKINRTVAVVLVFVSVFVGMFIYKLSQPVILSDIELRKKGVYLFENPRSFKDFSLLDYHGKEFTPENLQGKWSLVFFGFTYCPDVCPTTLALLNRFYKKQLEGDYVDDLQIIMASVDPARDTPEKLLSYVKYFNEDFVGVTGEFLDLHRFAQQLNIPFSKVPGGGSDYQVQHSGNVVIINPRGHYVGFFRAPLDLGVLESAYLSIRLSRG